jgi:uncharacterized membrane protein HdeD (DUF308 family)
MAEAPVENPIASKVAQVQEYLLDRPPWELVIRGILIVIFGILAIIYPGLTLALLIIFFGAFVFIEGIFHMVGSFAVKAENPQWILMFLNGLFNFIIGVIVLSWPGMSALVLLYFIGAWALITGTVQIVFGLRAPGGGGEKGVHIIGGIIGICFGLLAFTWPDVTAWSIVTIIGIFAIFFGIQLIVLGLLGGGDGGSASKASAA